MTLTRFGIVLLALVQLVAVSDAHADELLNSDNTLASFVNRYCMDCHGSTQPEGNLDLSHFDPQAASNAEKSWDTSAWEKIVRRLQSRQMPPTDADRPRDEQYEKVIDAFSNRLMKHADRYLNPGRTESIRRLTRYEYQNAVRDLLKVDINANDLLPPDESSHGFDNITVGELTPVLLSRYISAAEVITRVAVGGRQLGPGGVTLRIPADLTQESHVEGLPLGTRGGGLLQHTFSQGGEYDVQIRLTRDRDEYIEGLKEEHEIDVLLDRKRVHRFVVKPPKGGHWQGRDDTKIDSNLVVRLKIPAGPHEIGVTFPQKSRSLLEIKRQPFEASYNRHRHPRQNVALFEVSVVGPFKPTGPGRTPSRKAIFTQRPGKNISDLDAARAIYQPLLRKAYRREITNEDLAVPMQFFESSRKTIDFDTSIGAGIAAILVNPNFLFRIEHTPKRFQTGDVYQIDDYEIASRLSFFLWSSLPDEQLLKLAEHGQLQDESVLESETRRMLADPKSKALVANFASQWLYLRNLDSITPDLRRFPDFDDNLRKAFREETERLFESVVHQDKSVLTLIDSDETFLNERLATHYGIPNITGSHFRKVSLPEGSHRGGILRHGSILTVTSYATRTSPTIRGNWVLENIMGTPPPPPPPNVPTLKEKESAKLLTVRERLAIHRSNPACASCHELMDPIGFALENYDAVGRWRNHEGDQPLDVSGVLPNGMTVKGISDLEAALLAYPKLFTQALTEKLMIYALGRGIEPYDGPAVRTIVDAAEQNNNRFSSLIVGIVKSRPFRMRTAQ